MAEETETKSETETEQAEQAETAIDEQGRNPTQQRMDEEGVEAAPVDAEWTSGDPEGSDPSGPVEGFEAQTRSSEARSDPSSSDLEGSDPAGPVESGAAAANEPIFEPDVPLVAEVNREAPAKSRKGIVAAVAAGFAVLVAVVLRRRR